MSAGRLAVAVLLVQGGVLAALAALGVGARALRLRAERLREVERDRVRGLLMALLADADEEGPPLPRRELRLGIGRRHRRTVVAVTSGLLGKLRGRDRALLVEVLDRYGVLEAARRRTYRRGALGRAQAALLLGTAARPGGILELARLLRDRDRLVRENAAAALGKLGDPAAVPFLLAAVAGPRGVPAAQVTTALLHLGPAAVPQLRAGLAAVDPVARAVAAGLLGAHGALEATPDLVTVLDRDAEPHVRAAAAAALGRISSPHAVPALLAAVTAPGARLREVRAAAASALGAVGDAVAVPALVAVLHGDDAPAARAAAHALARCGAPGRAALTALLAPAAGAAAAEAGTPGPGAGWAAEALDELTLAAVPS